MDYAKMNKKSEDVLVVLTDMENVAECYLKKWKNRDKELFDNLNSDNIEEQKKAISKIFSKYKVARNFFKEFDVDAKIQRERFFHAFDTFVQLDEGDFPKLEEERANLVWSITKVSEDLSEVYGKRKLLSATTKLLWFKFRDQILIYDSQVVSALKLNDDNIISFYMNWYKAFDGKKAEIEKACKKLSEPVANELWFHKRVFDLYLWERGKK